MDIFSIKRNPKEDRFSEEMAELGTYRSRHSQVFLLIFRRKSDWKRTFLAWILVLQKLLNLESSWTKYISLKMKPYIQVMVCLLCKAIYILFSKWANIWKLRRKTWGSWKLETQTKERSNINTNLEEKLELEVIFMV